MYSFVGWSLRPETLSKEFANSALSSTLQGPPANKRALEEVVHRPLAMDKYVKAQTLLKAGTQDGRIGLLQRSFSLLFSFLA